jgi:hypothetical protein
MKWLASRSQISPTSLCATVWTHLLTLQNRAPSETTARVTLFGADGRSQALAPIAIAPYSFIQLDLKDVVEGDEFKSGNIQVAFTGLPMILAAQISITSLERRLSFESRAQAAMDFLSTKLNGILWLPQPAAEGSLAITNVATTSVTVHLAFGGKQETLTLPSRSTEVVKFNQELDRQSGTPVLIKLQHDGLPGDIITTGFVLDSGTGYSSGFTMFDSSIMTSSELAGVHFRFGAADPSEGFPEGTSFRAPLLLANVGSQPMKAQISVDYTTSANQFNHLSVKKLSIAPGEVQRIELTDELAQLGIAGPVAEAGVEITYDAPPGTLIAQLTSFDQTGDLSFEVPIKDPHAFNEQMEGIYPWTIRNGVRSVLHLKNTTADPATALLIFELPGGKFYQPSRIALQPFQSVAVDIGALRNSHIPDALKRPFPADATTGLADWRQEIPYSMIGRLEQIDLNGRISHSFSCGQMCCTNFKESAYVTPDSVTGPVGASLTLAGGVKGTACDGSSLDNPASLASLKSLNTNVATVDSSGHVTLTGPGTTTITATISVQYYFEFSIFPSSPPQCDLGTKNQPVSVSITVQPSITVHFGNNAPLTQGDNLSFSNVAQTCSGTLGLKDCSSKFPSTWVWNVEIEAIVEDAAKYTVSQGVTGLTKGFYKDTTGRLQSFSTPTNSPAPQDNPPAGALQQVAGQKMIFWLDAPGRGTLFAQGEPIDSMTQVKNFSSSICVTASPTTCFNVAWYLKIVVKPGAVLDTANSAVGFGSLSLNF